ncbi:MAG: hypothetical protein FWE14_08850 [Lachnospiraceae bacterium]|nr:hypothetical protein [Lachnospiraceae bacterium]
MRKELIKLGIDADDAIYRFAGKEALYLKSLKKFVVDITTNGVINVGEAVAMNLEDLGKYVHGLKGVTANLSMTKINALLIEIEQTIKAGTPDYAKYEYFCTKLPELARQILALITASESPARTDKVASGSEAECREQLRLLYSYLQRGLARECEGVTTELRDKEWAFFEKARLSKICDAVDGYDYAGAMEMIDDL